MCIKNKLHKLSGCLYVDGRFVQSTSSEKFDVVDPATENIIGTVANSTAMEVESAIMFANKAQKKWRETEYLMRSELLHGVARKLREMAPLLAGNPDS